VVSEESIAGFTSPFVEVTHQTLTRARMRSSASIVLLSSSAPGAVPEVYHRRGTERRMPVWYNHHHAAPHGRGYEERES